MAALKWQGPPLRNAGSDPRNCHELASRDNSDHKPAVALPQGLPSRATLARRFPALRVNRLTWRWADDASGAKGDDFQSLLAFLREGGGAR